MIAAAVVATLLLLDLATGQVAGTLEIDHDHGFTALDRDCRVWARGDWSGMERTLLRLGVKHTQDRRKLAENWCKGRTGP